MARVDDHKPVQRIKPHQVAHDCRVGKRVRRVELHPVGGFGHRASHGDLERLGLGERKGRQQEAKSLVVEDARVAGEEDDDRVLRPCLGLSNDVGECIGKALPAHFLIGEDAEQSLFALGIDAAIVKHLADRLRVARRVGETKSVVVSDANRDDVNTSPFEFAVVRDFQVGRPAVDRLLTTCHRVKPIDLLNQPSLDGELPGKRALVVFKAGGDRNPVVVDA